MARAFRMAVLAALLAFPGTTLGAEDPPPADTPARRFETVFFVTLPFSSLYSGALVLLAAAIIQKGRVDFTVPYQVTTISLAVAGAGWSAWRDAKTGGPDLKGISFERSREKAFSCQLSAFSQKGNDGFYVPAGRLLNN